MSLTPKFPRTRSAIRIALICSGFANADTWAGDAAQPSDAELPSLQTDGEASTSSLQIRQIKVIGNTIFDPAEIRSLVAPFEGRSLGPDDLEALRLSITRRYIDAGYINSGAMIPPQGIVDGVLFVKVIEGRLTAAKISGAHHYKEAYLRQLMQPDAAEPLNVNDLQQRMQLLLQDGFLQQINAQLEPGDTPGSSILDAAVREGPRFKMNFSLADDRPPSVGETGGTLGVAARNLLGIGDNSSATFALTHGYADYEIDEIIPLLMPSASAFVRADKNHGSVVESSVKDLGIISKEISAEAGVSAQLIHNLRNNFNESLSIYYNETQTYLLGVPFSFTGTDDGPSRVTALRYALDWAYRGTQQVIAARSVINVGLGGIARLGASIHKDDDAPDSRFAVWNWQAQYLRQLTIDDEALLRASLQLASRELLPSEKIAIGGIDTVRGYAANTLVRDQGGFASAEYRHTVYRLRLPGISHEANDGALSLAAFYDAGAGGDKGNPHTWISGTGGGIRWTPASNCSLVFYKAATLHHLSTQGGGPEDQGLHFRISYEMAL